MINTAFPESPAEVLSPQGLRQAMRSLPEFERMEAEFLHAEVANVEKREELAHRIADGLLHHPEQYPDLPDKQELVDEILARLDGLEEELLIEKEELLRKSETFDRINADPEKRGLLRRACDAVKSGWKFTLRHKWKILAAIAVIATGVAAWYYWEQLAALLGEGWSGLGTGGAEGVAETAAEGSAGTAEGAQAASEVLTHEGVVERAVEALPSMQTGGVLQEVTVVGHDAVVWGTEELTRDEFLKKAAELAAKDPESIFSFTNDPSSTVGNVQEIKRFFNANKIIYQH